MENDAPTPEAPINLQGKLLLAAPALRSGIFGHSVILLTEHSPRQGAHGLILNHPTDRLVGDLLEDESFVPLRKLTVYEGGPVAREQLTFSVFWQHPEQGLRWAVRISAEEAIKHAQRPGTIVRAFIGYSGWSVGQLENELRLHSWIPTRPGRELLGYPHDQGLWAQLLRRMSPFHRILAEAPANPLLN